MLDRRAVRVGKAAGELAESDGSGCLESVSLRATFWREEETHDPAVCLVAATLDPATLPQFGDQTADGALLQTQADSKLGLREALGLREIGEGMRHRDADRHAARRLVWLQKPELAHKGSDPRLKHVRGIHV